MTADTLDVVRSWLAEFSPYMPEPIRDAWARDLVARMTAAPTGPDPRTDAALIREHYAVAHPNVDAGP